MSARFSCLQFIYSVMLMDFLGFFAVYAIFSAYDDEPVSLHLVALNLNHLSVTCGFVWLSMIHDLHFMFWIIEFWWCKTVKLLQLIRFGYGPLDWPNGPELLGWPLVTLKRPSRCPKDDQPIDSMSCIFPWKLDLHVDKLWTFHWNPIRQRTSISKPFALSEVSQ